MVFIFGTFCSDVSHTISNPRKMRIEDLREASSRKSESEIRAGKAHCKEIGDVGGDCGNGNEKM